MSPLTNGSKENAKEVLNDSKNPGAISGIDAIAASTTVYDSTLNWATGSYTLTKGPGEPGIPESAKGITGVDQSAPTPTHEREIGNK